MPPTPKPTALRVLEGNPGKRALNKQEPHPAAGAPPCPSWLDPWARVEWRRVVPELTRLGVLARIDQTALAAYCQSYARWRQAEATVTRDGFTRELRTFSKSGEEYVYAVMPLPEVAISQRERQLMKAFLAEFGLSPASRSRITTAEVPPSDPFEEWSSGRRGTS